MAIIVIFIAVILSAFVVLGYFGRVSMQKRGRLLEKNGFFVERTVEEAQAALGLYSRRYSRWGGRVDYVWGAGSSSVLLISNEQRTVVDYCPGRKGPKFVSHYFEQNKDSIVGKKVWDIKRDLGESNEYVSFDFGETCDTWKATKRTIIEVWSKGDTCTNLVFKKI